MRLPALFDVWVLGAVLVTIMGGAMWADRMPGTCVMRPEPARTLRLDRELDREHLSRDRAEMDRVVKRVTAERQDQAGSCAATLAGQILATHGVTTAQLGDVR